LSEEYVLPFWASYARFNTGLARFDAGDREDGVEKMIQAFDEVPESTWSVLWIYYATQLADALGRIGRADEGLGWLDRAQAITDEGGERWSEIEVWLVRGDLQISIGSKNEPAAESNYSQALELARSQQAKSWELRAASRIARLWHSQGKTTEALNMLTPVYGWFTEGFDTADLKEAKVLLDELS
jgi:predicted ATPase